jgi:dynein heavy chain 1
MLGMLVSAPIGQAIHRLLLIQAFRPDRLLAMAHMFVSTNLGESFMSIMEQPLDLTHIVGTEVMPHTSPFAAGNSWL